MRKHVAERRTREKNSSNNKNNHNKGISKMKNKIIKDE